MDEWIVFTLLLFSNGVQYASSDRLNIIPSPDSACPGEFTGEPCLTLQQYVANPSLSSDITLELQPGNHNLDVRLSAEDIDSFSMRATTNASVSCTSLGEFQFEGRLELIHVSGITFNNCRIEVSLHSSDAVVIDHCTFENYQYCCNTGALYFSHNGDINIHNSNFTGNRVSRGEGAAIYVTRAQELTITNSYFSHNAAGGHGGAVYFDGGNVTISNTIFTNNTSVGGGGGAIYSAGRYTGIVLTNNAFRHNTAAYCGVLDVYEFYHPHVNVTENTFSHNRAMGQVAGNNDGGVICVTNASISVLNNNFTHNSALGNAGVLRVDESDVIVEGSIFSNNTAGGDGGVFHTYFYPTTYTVTHSSFTNNQAGSDGGVMYVGRADSHVTIHHSTFSSNSATDRGGVIAVVGSTLLINGVTVFDNTARLGGEVSACNSNVTISNPEIPATQDLVQPSCSLYGNSTTPVSMTTQDDILTTTPEEESTTEDDMLTTAVSLTEAESNTEDDSLTTTASTTEEESATEDNILATTASPTEEEIFSTTASPIEEESTTEDDILTSTASPATTLPIVGSVNAAQVNTLAYVAFVGLSLGVLAVLLVLGLSIILLVFQVKPRLKPTNSVDLTALKNEYA